MRIPLLITLEDDIVISASSATTGGHESLDYIPGSLLFGASANRLYKKLKDHSHSQTWDVFHSGKVRFLNGYPLSKEGYASYPPPLSIHYYKGEEPDGPHSIYSDESVLRLGGITKLNPNKKDRQPKQLRKDYLTDHGYRVDVVKTASMKTAIDGTTGHAATSQLFGYQAIQAGATFLAYLEIDDDLNDVTYLVDELKNSLEGRARIGRSRSAQYGRVTLECLDSNLAQQPSIYENTCNDSVAFLCLSDLALIESTTGQPTLTPKACHFGLPETAEFDVQNSFMRSRLYSPFNAYRKAFDSQRHVICQGSVLRFTNISEFDVKALPTHVGRYQEMGLGHIAINPSMCLANEAPGASKPFEVQSITSSLKTSDESHLIKWLKHQPDTLQENAHDWLNALIGSTKNQQPATGTIAHFYQVARQFNAIDDNLPIGPSRSQWGEVYQHARDLRRNPQQLIHDLFLKKDTRDPKKDRSICRERAGSQHSWGLEMSYNQSFKLWLAQQLLASDTPFTTQEQLEDFVNKNSKCLTTELCQKITQLAADMRTDKRQSIRVKGADHA